MRYAVFVQGYVYGTFTSLQAAQIWVSGNITDGSPYQICQFINVDTP
jgi:hypothetical protein